MHIEKKHTNNLQRELWQTTHQWLIACGCNVIKNYCKEEITTHPDYPALTSVTDFLDTGNMPYNAVQADASYIHEFNYPMLAHIRNSGQEYIHIIHNTADWNKQKEITAHWTGIAIYPEKNAQWQNAENTTYKNTQLKNKIVAVALAITGLALYIISTFQLLNFSTGIFGLLSLIGLIISLYALGTELGFQSQIVKQVCGAVSNGSCVQVLKSRYAKGFAGITPADASVLYFAAQFIVYLIGSFYAPLLQSILLWAFAGIAIAAWSIYTQAIKLKQWCALCLAIAAVLILQAILAFSIRTTAINYFGLLNFILLFMLLAFVLLPVKQLIKTNSSNKLKLAELKKWKTDAELFISQWQREQEVDTTIWQHDLLLGNPAAPLQITVACNPYCGPCAKAHKQLDKILHRFPGKINVQLRLLCNAEDESDKCTIAVKSILQKAAAVKDNKELQALLNDWFVFMDYEKWMQKWKTLHPMQSEDESEVRLYSQWATQSHIVFTPTFFINGKKLPGRYHLNDLEILIPQLAEILQPKTEWIA